MNYQEKLKLGVAGNTIDIPDPTSALLQLTADWLPGHADRIADWIDRHMIHQPDFMTDLVIALSECAAADAKPDELIDVMRRFADDPAAFRNFGPKTEDLPSG